MLYYKYLLMNTVEFPINLQLLFIVINFSTDLKNLKIEKKNFQFYSRKF